jgi:hypothetical protein
MQDSLISVLRLIFLFSLGVAAGCGGNSGSNDGVSDGAGSEIATSVVSGAMNTGGGSTLGRYLLLVVLTVGRRL